MAAIAQVTDTGADRPLKVRLAEWTTAGPKDTPSLSGVRRLTEAEAARAAELTRLGLVEVLEVRDGLRVRTTSYVGVIPLGPVMLHIRPKFADLSPAAMAVFLRYALHLKALNRFDDPADAPLADAGFADLIALALLDEVNALLRAGLLREYETRQDWRSSPRGRLEMSALARHPLRAVTTFAVPCRFAKRTTDNPLNRLTRAALDALRPLVSDTGVAFDLHARAALLDELCTPAPLTSSLWDEAAATLDRRTHHYRPVVELAALILKGLGVTVDTTERRAPGLPAFILDMNRLFERFVARLLAEYAPRRFRVTTQESRDTAYRWHDNPHKWQTPRLRPDLVVFDAATNGPRLVLDTKYKPLGPGRRPAPADLYQLTLYALSFGPVHGSLPAVLLYPAANSTTTATGEESLLEFRGQTERTLATIRFIGLPLVDLSTALRGEDHDHIMRMLAPCFPSDTT
jgi:5-methylcytosine-specific restriction enzyme subunit McrC